MTASGFTSQGSLTPDTLIAGEFPRVTRTETIAAGANLTRGALLGRITASGKFKLSAAAANDGSEVPEAILLVDAPAAAADVQSMIALTGEYNEDALVLGAGHTIGSIKQGLRQLSIFLRKIVAA